MHDKTERQRVLLESSRKRVLIGHNNHNNNDDNKSKRVLIDEQPLPFDIPVKMPRRVAEGVSSQEERFLQHWITHYTDPGKSARFVGYPSPHARKIGFKLLATHAIQDRLAEIERETMSRAALNPEQLFREIVSTNLRLARARVPVQVWNPPCRYCYGTNNEYQRTHAEFETEFEEHVKAPRNKKGGKVALFDPKGGAGYDPTLPPEESCPNCHGEGDTEHPVIRFKDSRLFSPEERELFSGAKYTKTGVETFWKDQASARNFLNDLALRMTDYHKPQEEEPIDITAMSVHQLRQLLEFAKDQGFDVDLEELDNAD